ncbi:hypothetical protein DEU56DRAFT_832967 [Suillus clintonianus]|uniref:uncharacterized protein n=1 Tax=Suillus clintonianus TaxID=1904413 RepID=UPI001B85E759|nr:uncharacterized protein DEU56DRAFT_832967 [Suillus clintonianus]KAG2121949.1 hypothetical protein DEU56DRAFT_832967 [Suillus clintonianus]
MDTPMPEPLPVEKQQIRIVVQGPDEKSNTSSVVHQASSFVWSMPTPSVTSSQSCASLNASHRPSSSEGTTLASRPYSSSSSPNPSGASFKDAPPEITITASDVKRNDRGRIIPKLTAEFKMGFYVEPGQTDFDNTQGYGDWAPQIHPDGALYYFDSKRRIYTDADLSAEGELEIINYYAERLLRQAREVAGFPCNTCELVLERKGKWECGYYFVEPGKRCILWLTAVPSGLVTRNLERVQSYSQIKYAMEAEYWMHCMLFPNNWSLTALVLAELEKIILHAIADSITSTTSVIPFDQEELAKMLDLTDRLKDELDEPFLHAKCIVARFMENFALAKFFNFCGQPGARLNSDQSIFSKQRPRNSLFIEIISICLFWAPCDYAKELEGIWVDRVINRVLWRQFIAKLNDDWSSLALTATVVLNANVAFLTLVVDDTLARTFSFISTMTSVGVVILGLILVRQNQRKDQNSAEQANVLLTRMSHPVFRTEVLAIIYSLPYALLMWSMVFFIIAFACMVFGSAKPITQSAFSVAGGLVCVFVCWTVWATRATSEHKGLTGSN